MGKWRLNGDLMVKYREIMVIPPFKEDLWIIWKSLDHMDQWVNPWWYPIGNDDFMVILLWLHGNLMVKPMEIIVMPPFKVDRWWFYGDLMVNSGDSMVTEWDLMAFTLW